MNIVCVKKCYSIHRTAYKLGDVYSYYEDDYIDGLEIKYHPLYDKKGNVIGYQNLGFINENFVSEFDYSQELGYINHMYSFFMDHGIKIKDIKSQIM